MQLLYKEVMGLKCDQRRRRRLAMTMDLTTRGSGGGGGPKFVISQSEGKEYNLLLLFGRVPPLI